MADNNANQERPRGFEALKQHVIDNKVDVALWASRVLTIIFAFGFMLPIFGYGSIYKPSKFAVFYT